MRAHAILSPSASKRWMACPPSARLEEKLHDRFGEQSSPFAAEGTKAHAVAELKLLREKGKLGDADGINQFNYDARLKALGEIPKDMHVATDLYVDIVMEKLFTARRACPDAKLFVEQRLSMDRWVPGCFGTSDAVVVSDEILDVCDYKNGSGVRVNAQENPQARCYGLGAIDAFGDLYGFQTVRNTIIQPRLDHITEEQLSRTELLTWADTELTPKAQLAWRGEGNFNPGEHCRFCAARAICYARATQAMKLFQTGMDAPAVLPDSEIPQMLSMADDAITWLGELKAYALRQALKGQRWPGYKLVHGKRPRRTWRDEESAREQLIRAGYKPEQFEEHKLKSAAAVEKLIGKTAFDVLLKDQTVQGEGALILAPETDGRPEYSTADIDFSDMGSSNTSNINE